MSSHETHTEHHSHGPAIYVWTLLALLVLTVITVLASYVNFGSPAANVVIALFIATVKASLVCLIFMHLKDDRPINGIIFVSTLLFLGVFIGFCLIDFESRTVIRPANYKGPAQFEPTPKRQIDATKAPAAATPAEAKAN
jgi:cytochrome c oxidase subunit IV